MSARVGIGQLDLFAAVGQGPAPWYVAAGERARERAQSQRKGCTTCGRAVGEARLCSACRKDAVRHLARWCLTAWQAWTRNWPDGVAARVDEIALVLTWLDEERTGSRPTPKGRQPGVLTLAGWDEVLAELELYQADPAGWLLEVGPVWRRRAQEEAA